MSAARDRRNRMCWLAVRSTACQPRSRSRPVARRPAGPAPGRRSPRSPDSCAVHRRCAGAGGGSRSQAPWSPVSASQRSPWSMPFATTLRIPAESPQNPGRDPMARSSKLAEPGSLGLGESAAGAGALGVLGAAAVFVIAIVFFVAESYFRAMLLVSLAMLVYVAGGELGKLVRSSLAVFFSGRHVIAKAVHLQDTVTALRKLLYMKRDEHGNIKFGPIEAGAKLKLP